MTRGADEAQLRSRLRAGLAQMNLMLASDQISRMVAYLSLLQRWNRAYNLTAVREPLEMVPKHLLDSLSVLPYLFGDRVLDVGTGAGLPGLPLAVASPRRAFCLLDSSGKKIRFLRQVVMDLGLANVEVVQARMESYLPEEKFATIVSRAVTSVPDLLAATGRLLARPARLLVMKGQRPSDTEIRGLVPSPAISRVHRLEVPFLDAKRHLVDARYD
jgi:16S rRNA (guanine527-N7)-methyltransferase